VVPVEAVALGLAVAPAAADPLAVAAGEPLAVAAGEPLAIPLAVALALAEAPSAEGLIVVL
jgi:hypothetical protein